MDTNQNDLQGLVRLCRDAKRLASNPWFDDSARFEILWNYCRFELERAEYRLKKQQAESEDVVR
jgi:hypothetical protein